MTPRGKSTQAPSRLSWLKGVERGPLIVVVTAFGLGVLGVALYAVEPDREWVKIWVPGIAGGLLVGALTVLALNVILASAGKQAAARRRRPLELAAARETRELRTKVDQFLEKWQEVIGEMRGDYLEVLGAEESAASFPEALISRLPFDTFRLLESGWGQPNHERVLAAGKWGEAVELAGQVKRQSDRIVEWYSTVLGFTNLVALGRIQEYLLSVVENMPRAGRTNWFSEGEAHRAFLAEYRALWPEDDPAADEARKETRGMQFAIWEGLRDGTAERHTQEKDRAYVDPALVSLYDELNPLGPREERYLELMMSARAVLDLGCGTGRLLKRTARAEDSGAGAGKITRALIGVDREPEMLAAAESAGDQISWEESLISWRDGDARTVDIGRRFDLIVMTGGTFQELLNEAEIRMVLSNVVRHLDPGGRFAFDAHPPDNDPSEHLTPKASEARVATGSGEWVKVVRALQRTIDPDLIEFTTTYTFPGSSPPAVSRSVLRFGDFGQLRALLEEVGFRIDSWFGDPDRRRPPQQLADDVAIATYVH